MIRCRRLDRFLSAACLATLAATVAAIPAPAHASSRCAGETLPLIKANGGGSPYVMLRADSRHGAFQLDFGSTRSSLSSTAFPAPPQHRTHVLAAFSLPSFATGTFQLSRYDLVRHPPGGQLGIVGTDFLSQVTTEFDLRAGTVVIGARPCDPGHLRARGMVAIPQDGHFSSNPARLRADRPNVPVLPLRLGDVKVMAQVDTGYDDAALPPSIDINEPLYRRLVDAGIALQSAGSLTVTTCRGRETRSAYRLPPAWPRLRAATAPKS
jgi:hypothetical protein